MNVPTVVPLIGRQPPKALESSHTDAGIWKPDGLIKESRWWVLLDILKKVSIKYLSLSKEDKY